MASLKLGKDAIEAWDKVKDIQDIYLWHLAYTPWFNKETILELMKIYDEKLKSVKPDDLRKEESKFETLFKKSF